MKKQLVLVAFLSVGTVGIQAEHFEQNSEEVLNLKTNFKNDLVGKPFDKKYNDIVSSIMKQSEKFHHDGLVPQAITMIREKMVLEVQFFYNKFFPKIKTISDLNKFMAANTVDKMKNLLHHKLRKTTIDQLIKNEVESQTGSDQFGIDVYSSRGYHLLGKKLVWEALVASLSYMQPIVDFLNSKAGVSSKSCNNSLYEGDCKDFMTTLKLNDIYGKMNFLLRNALMKWLNAHPAWWKLHTAEYNGNYIIYK